MQYYRTRVTDQQGRRVSLYARTREKLYQKEQEAIQQIENKTYRRSTPTLERSGKVQERLRELREKAREIEEEQAEAACLTRVRKRQILTAIAEDPQASAADRCRAIDLDNKMEGEYVEKVSVSGSPNNPFEGLSTEQLLRLAGEER